MRVIYFFPWVFQKIDVKERVAGCTCGERIGKDWEDIMGVLWSFELGDDLAAPCDELCRNMEWEDRLSLLTDWL